MGIVNIVSMDVINDQLPVLRSAGASKNQASSEGAAAGSTHPAGGEYVRVLATEACYYRQGVGAQTAVAGDFMLAAGIPEYFRKDGSTHFSVLDVA